MSEQVNKRKGVPRRFEKKLAIVLAAVLFLGIGLAKFAEWVHWEVVIPLSSTETFTGKIHDVDWDGQIVEVEIDSDKADDAVVTFRNVNNFALQKFNSDEISEALLKVGYANGDMSHTCGLVAGCKYTVADVRIQCDFVVAGQEILPGSGSYYPPDLSYRNIVSVTCPSVIDPIYDWDE